MATIYKCCNRCGYMRQYSLWASILSHCNEKGETEAWIRLKETKTYNST